MNFYYNYSDLIIFRFAYKLADPAFLIPAMVLILLVLTIFRKPIENGYAEETEAAK